jgi:hypothetical protein
LENSIFDYNGRSFGCPFTIYLSCLVFSVSLYTLRVSNLFSVSVSIPRGLSLPDKIVCRISIIMQINSLINRFFSVPPRPLREINRVTS